MNVLWTSLGATGLALVILGIIAFVIRTWVATFIERSIGHAFDLQLEQFKEDIRGSTAQILALQSAANTSLNEGQRVAAERRIQAADRMWQEILRLKHETLFQIKLLDMADDSGEYDVLLRNPGLQISQASLLEKYLDITVLEQERPFIGDKVFALCDGYRTIVLQMVLLLSNSVKNGHMNLWHEDEHTLSVVREMLSPEEIEEFWLYKPGHAVWTTNLIEEKILDNLRRVVAGAQSVEEGVELGREILKAVAQVREDNRGNFGVVSYRGSVL